MRGITRRQFIRTAAGASAAKAVNGMPTKRAMEWAQEQVVQAVRGQLKASG